MIGAALRAFALEAPVQLDPATGLNDRTAVQVALIVALAPIVLVVVNELLRRWRARYDPAAARDDGALAPVEEVPAGEYVAQLDLVADLDERLRLQQRAHQLELEEHRHEVRQVREELDRTRRDLVAELERRVRAETLLESRKDTG